MATCSYSTHVGGSCGSSIANPAALECVPLGSCLKQVKVHLQALDVRDAVLKNEAQLLLARAGLFKATDDHLKMTICPRHRELHGTRWRSNKKKCLTPVDWAPHKSKQFKGDRGITSAQSKGLYEITNPSFLLAHDGESNSEDLTKAISRLTLDEDTTAVFSSEATSSSSESLAHVSSHYINVLRREKLNEFLHICSKGEIATGQPKQLLENLDIQRKSAYVGRATTAIVAALEVITPGDAGSLWEAVKSSYSVKKALGIAEQQSADIKYLKALAETYQHATSWDTRRQILAIIADLAPLREIQQFIPGLTEYRFKTARMHILKHGRGAPVSMNRSPRMRVNESQLDHFLTYITSSHVIQDLPFGQRYLHLSNGQVLETPNVIRSMIPQRIIEQYVQFCQECNVKPLSPSTISRVLTVCSATVRKSLQGLDYIAADGAKAFDDLAAIVTKLGICDLGKEWVSSRGAALKAGKQYTWPEITDIEPAIG